MQNRDNSSEIITPKDPHIACLFLVDTSGIMGIACEDGSTPIDKLNKALNGFIEAMSDDQRSQVALDVAIVTFSSAVQVLQPFAPVTEIQSVMLPGAHGATDLVAGLCQVIDMIKEKSRQYHATGTPQYTPWLVIITDGFSTSEYDLQGAMVERIRALDQERKLRVVSLAVEDADIHLLKRLSSKKCFFRLKDMYFLPSLI